MHINKLSFSAIDKLIAEQEEISVVIYVSDMI
jgi:hypothetical protein